MKHILRLSVLLAIVFIICKDMVLILNLNNMNMIEKFYQSIKKFEIPFILYRKKKIYRGIVYVLGLYIIVKII